MEVNTDAISLKGKITNLNGFTVKEYGICWSPTNQIPVVTDQKLGIAKTITQPLDFEGLQMRNLVANTTYYIRAYAVTTDNKTGYSEVITAKTYQTYFPLSQVDK